MLKESCLIVGAGQKDHVVLREVGGEYTKALGPRADPTLLWPCLTKSTPSASTSKAQMPGFSTKGSPKPLWGTVTKAGSVLGGKATGWLCSVPGVERIRYSVSIHRRPESVRPPCNVHLPWGQNQGDTGWVHHLHDSGGTG